MSTEVLVIRSAENVSQTVEFEEKLRYSGVRAVIVDSIMQVTAQSLLRIAIAMWAIAFLLAPIPAGAATSTAVRSFNDAKVETKDYAGQSLIEVEFSGADLEDANFSDADLRGAVFTGSSLKNADFSGANFAYGIGYLTSFKGTDFSNAILTEAMLLRSTFDDAKIEGADFSDAVLDRTEVKKLCAIASGVNPTTGVNTRASLLCR
ncbi:putative low-complexity protein [Rubidibacter lacunae KORDI 51-2]|uniref:Putative low-complexity protein n=1 Tax=Rubidibacter lacunae KORDI 51-2 TaxID=582515 RepID=U5DLT4_9CHRO|nr:pentapeptide repeat-containing protein [Rubidibacter lacunae]ERN42611.1 putative low-complexity protein [Rubidibacter lacunae KORDI 51-2]